MHIHGDRGPTGWKTGKGTHTHAQGEQALPGCKRALLGKSSLHPSAQNRRSCQAHAGSTRALLLLTPPPALGLLRAASCLLEAPKLCTQRAIVPRREAGAVPHVPQAERAQARHSLHIWLTPQSPGPQGWCQFNVQQRGPGPPGWGRAGETELQRPAGHSLLRPQGKPRPAEDRTAAHSGHPGGPQFKSMAPPQPAPPSQPSSRFQGFGLIRTAVFQHYQCPPRSPAASSSGVSSHRRGNKAQEEMGPPRERGCLPLDPWTSCRVILQLGRGSPPTAACLEWEGPGGSVPSGCVPSVHCGCSVPWTQNYTPFCDGVSPPGSSAERSCLQAGVGPSFGPPLPA
ncbi:proline-rich protein HaeIII subfamily 1-like [Cynocephalus volans]|uniref:proline-rich protein HaeIII subfamily 1-like n=1 Tax=Cynocephalus volans TaxID=110931 RepID=UPI002FC8F478